MPCPFRSGATKVQKQTSVLRVSEWSKCNPSPMTMHQPAHPPGLPYFLCSVCDQSAPENAQQTQCKIMSNQSVES